MFVSRDFFICLILFLCICIGVALAFGIWSLGVWGVGSLQKETRYDKIIINAAKRNGIDPCLLKAVIWRESKFQVKCKGSKGEIGLMQIMENATVRDWEKATNKKIRSVGILYDPELNIEIGSWYLGRALEYWKDYRARETLALCEYNAGRTRAIGWKPLLPDQEMIESIDISSTRKYVDVILEKRKEYTKTWNLKKK